MDLIGFLASAISPIRWVVNWIRGLVAVRRRERRVAQREKEIDEEVELAGLYRKLVQNNIDRRLLLVKARIESLFPKFGHPRIELDVEIDNLSIFPLILERATD
jgi:hypothetical protein